MTDEPSASADEADPLIGQTIGSYEILRVLGKGGMGAVYLAEHPIIHSQVAIKFLHPQYAADRKVVDRFFNEARAVNVIGHPNILKILDLNVTPDQRHYFVMEFLHGRPLTSLIREGGVGLDVAGPILLQCCAALDAAHQHGIIHRDLKPDNVYLVSHLGRANFVKIVDFGIAKLTDPGDGSSGHTQTGTVMGTPAYMSPEQATGDAHIDGRSDVYSLGVMMFQLATGRLPFEDTNFGKLLISHVQKQPPAPRSIAPAIPEQWEQVILRSLEKDPAARQQSMAELHDELHGCLEELGISAELPLDPGPAAGTGARLPSDPGRRRTPAAASAPRLTPTARKSSLPRTEVSGPAMRVSTGRGSKAAPAGKRRTGLIVGVSALAVAALVGGGLFASGAFDEARAPRRERAFVEKIAEAAPVRVPPVEARREAGTVAAPEKPADPPAPVQAAAVAEPPAHAAKEEPAAQAPEAEPPAEKQRTRRSRTVAEAAPGVRLSVVSDPPGADVIARWSGGEKRGKAPFQFDAPRGSRVKLEFSLKGYSPSQEDVTADAPRTVSSELVQLLGD